jgi:hypothetical protein
MTEFVEQQALALFGRLELGDVEQHADDLCRLLAPRLADDLAAVHHVGDHRRPDLAHGLQGFRIAGQRRRLFARDIGVDELAACRVDQDQIGLALQTDLACS